MLMKKILCPTDFSDAAQNATVYAAKLAQATHCDLTLLHVHSMFDLSLSSASSNTSSIQRPSLLELLSQEVSKAFKISCYAEEMKGTKRLSSIIHDQAQSYDLIVMGTNGPNDTYQLLSGSNTYNVIIKSETPLLIIPEDYQYHEVKTMVFAFDYLSMQGLKLTHLVPFVKSVKCELLVLQILEESPSKEFEKELKELQFIIRQYNNDLNIRFETIRDSDVVHGISSFILKTQPDVLALLFRHRNSLENLFHKSVIKNISAICNYPLYVFPLEPT